MKIILASLSIFIMGNVYAGNSNEYTCVTKNKSIIHFSDLDHEVEVRVFEDRGDIEEAFDFDPSRIISKEEIKIHSNRMKGEIHSQYVGVWSFIFNKRSKVLKFKVRALWFPSSTVLKAKCKLE